VEAGSNELHIHWNSEKLHGLKEPFHAVELHEAPDPRNRPNNIVAGTLGYIWVLCNRNKYGVDPEEQDKEWEQYECYDDPGPIQDYSAIMALLYNLVFFLRFQFVDFLTIGFINKSAFFRLPIYPYKNPSDVSHVLGHKGLNTPIQTLAECET